MCPNSQARPPPPPGRLARARWRLAAAPAPAARRRTPPVRRMWCGAARREPRFPACLAARRRRSRCRCQPLPSCVHMVLSVVVFTWPHQGFGLVRHCMVHGPIKQYLQLDAVPTVQLQQQNPKPLSRVLQLAVFRPGVYEVTDYMLSWTYPDLSSLHDTRPGPRLVLTVEDSCAPRATAAAAVAQRPLLDLL